MYLLTKDGIQKVPKKKFLRSLFCKHQNQMSGEHCSEIVLMRISGSDRYTICRNCGKVLDERHTQY